MITYPNAVDENGTVHNIGTITDSNRSEHKFYCLGCGKEMVPVLFKQQDRTCHFRHKVNESCNQETYLHNLAKTILARRLRRNRSLMSHTMSIMNAPKRNPVRFLDCFVAKSVRGLP